MKPMLTTHDFQATAVIVYAFLLRSQGLAFRANSPTKQAVIDETCTYARNWSCQGGFGPVHAPAPHCHSCTQQHQLNLRPFLEKTFHKSHTSLVFALFIAELRLTYANLNFAIVRAACIMVYLLLCIFFYGRY